MMNLEVKKFSSYLYIGLTALMFLSSAGYVHADLCPTKASGFSPLCTLKLEKASDITASIVTILLIFAVIISLIFLVYGGIRWIMSAGDKSKLEAARGTITGAVVGLIIAFSSYFILNIVTYLFTKTTFLKFTIPTIVP